MSNKQLTEIIKAIMCGSQLSPDFDNDYYEDFHVDNMVQFLEGLTMYFNIPRDSHITHFSNIVYLDCPSSTIKFLIGHKTHLLNPIESK